MPTDRFFRLPERKAGAIRDAAIREFMRVRPEEASINRIIRDAGISRGSFYTYFQDKYELLRWIVGDRIREHQAAYMERLKESGGDIWETLNWAFPHSMEKTLSDGFMQIFGNVVESSLLSEFLRSAADMDQEANEQAQAYLDRMYGLLDQKKYPMSRQMFDDLMELHGMIYMRVLKELLRDQTPLEQVVGDYRRFVQILRCGAGPAAE